MAGRTLTEADGYFSFLGLAPGSYTVQIDDAQLHKLKMTATPIAAPIVIEKSREGDQAGGINFVLKSF